MIKFKHRGRFEKSDRFLTKNKKLNIRHLLDRYGSIGVELLSANTPKDTGLTASSWSYKIIQSNGSSAIQWTNSNVSGGYHIALLLQYGHGTRHGAYVQGIDYINPALRDVFKQLADEVWKEVNRE